MVPPKSKLCGRWDSLKKSPFGHLESANPFAWILKADESARDGEDQRENEMWYAHKGILGWES
jgi:hypothetical protein